MKFEHMAAFLEEMQEHVQVMAGVPYLLDLSKEFSTEEVKDRMEKVSHFVKWFTEQCKDDLTVPRGRQGVSYNDVRQYP